jgi:hypothetical protein
MIVIAVLVAAVLVVLASFDVFWPLGLLLASAVAAGWWMGHSDWLLALWRPWYLAAYVPIGFAWVFFKWTRLIEKALRDKASRVPRWSDHWDEFVSHFFYWPVSVVAYVFCDFLQEVWRWLSRMVTRSFDRYAEWRFGTVNR